jgi:hypothetical protein
MFTRLSIYLIAASALAATSATAAPRAAKIQPPPPGFNQLVACRSIADSAQRLACYDREVAAVANANARGDLVVMDRQQVRQTRRSLFGLALPNLGVFGEDSLPGDADRLETTIKSVHYQPDGKYIFDLAEGGRWIALESRTFIVDPAAGQTVKIRRAALGSYLMNVNNQLALRVHRLN